MILQALVKYYEDLERQEKLPKQGWCQAKVSYGINLSTDGDIKNILWLKEERQAGKKQIWISQTMKVPAMLTRSSGVAANFLCDNSKYMLGIDKSGTGKRITECFEAAKEKHLKLLKNTSGEMAQAICAFFYKWNPEKAKELLKEAGVADGSLKLTILCDTDEVRVKTAQIIQAYLKEVGIDSEVTSFEQALWNTYQTDPTKFDLNISYNSAYGYITRIWNQLNSTRYAEHNMAMVRDDKLDNLLMTAAASQDDADIDAAKQYMVEEAYHYGLFHKDNYYITNKNKIIQKCP